MKETYVSFKVAKLLKEKGFDWKCNHYYMENISGDEHYLLPGSIMYSEDYNKRIKLNELGININTSSGKISAPTQQMACRWLREVYKMFISIGVGTDIDGVFGYMPSIYFLSILSCNEGRFVPNVDADDICNFTPQTYEDAVEAALEYALKNLI